MNDLKNKSKIGVQFSIFIMIFLEQIEHWNETKEMTAAYSANLFSISSSSILTRALKGDGKLLIQIIIGARVGVAELGRFYPDLTCEKTWIRPSKKPGSGPHIKNRIRIRPKHQDPDSQPCPEYCFFYLKNENIDSLDLINWRLNTLSVFIFVKIAKNLLTYICRL